MIVLNQKIKVRWVNNFSKYYQELGYPKLKQGEEFEIDANHVLKSSPEKANVKCDKCEDCVYSLSIRQIYKNRKTNNYIDICENCLSKENYCECKCGLCEKVFEITKYRRDRGEGKFCSKECYDEFQNQKINICCSNCGKKVPKKPCLVKDENFCSVVCANKYLNSKRKTRVELTCNHCGEEYVVKKYLEFTSSYCSEECRIKGSYNLNKTDEERQIERSYTDYNEWRKDVFKKDSYTCQCCGIKGQIVAHHLNGYHWAIDQRTEVDNGITLCLICHDDFHNIYGTRGNTIEQFHEYMEGISWNCKGIYKDIKLVI